MCGFIALVNNKRIPVDIGSLLKELVHRGPDDHGWSAFGASQLESGKEDTLCDAPVLLGHVRLAILDLSEAGHQPMGTPDSCYVLVFNGELYNYLELRGQLAEAGYTFRSETDTEVVLNSIAHWGKGALARFRGMFAFVCYDTVSNELFIARDFFGIKPFYWCCWEGGLAFASEVDPLLKLPGVSTECSPQASYEYLLSGASDHSEQSMYKDLHFLPAASYATVDLKGNARCEIQPTKYWDIPLNRTITPSFSHAVERVRELFLESVSLHMRSDVRVGAALSGGIDSSAIVCAMRHLYPDQEIHTFSFIADDEGISEEPWIDIVNVHTNSIPHKVHATKDDLVGDLDDLIRAQGEPFGSTSIYAQYRVFREARNYDIKVVLDGQGADEMLAGYVSYQGSRLATLIASMRWIKAFRFLAASSKWPDRSVKLLAFMAARELLPDNLRWIGRKLLSKAVPPRWISENWIHRNGIERKPNLLNGVDGPAWLRSRLYDTLTHSSIPHLLRYEDRNSMRFSIESRVPFLHVDLVEYLFSLPEEYLISDAGCSKYVFREAMRGIVPDAILDRQDKIGFATPEKAWLTQMDQWLCELFLFANQVDCFDQEELKKDWNAVFEGKSDFNFRCWRWLNFLAWEKAKTKQ